MTQENPFGGPAPRQLAGFGTSPVGYAPAPYPSSVGYAPAPYPSPVGYAGGQGTPQAYQPWGSGQIIAPQFAPTAGGRRSLPGRTSVIAGVVVLALIAFGVVFSGSRKAHDRRSAAGPLAGSAAAPVAEPAAKLPVPDKAPAKVPARKPAAKPVAAPLGGRWVAITRANSGTVGASYQIASPRDFTFKRGKLNSTAKSDHLDVFIGDGGETQEFGLLSYAWEGLPNGTLPPGLIKALRKGWTMQRKGRVALPGTSVATLAGVRATGFDFTERYTDGTKMRFRVVAFGHGGTLHTAVWVAPAADFAATLPMFQRIASTMTFTGASTRERPTSSTT